MVRMADDHVVHGTIEHLAQIEGVVRGLSVVCPHKGQMGSLLGQHPQEGKVGGLVFLASVRVPGLALLTLQREGLCIRLERTEMLVHGRLLGSIRK